MRSTIDRWMMPLALMLLPNPSIAAQNPITPPTTPPPTPRILPLLPAPNVSAPGMPDDSATIATIDPLAIDDDDFARHNDPATWRGLTVQRIGFREGHVGWRLWRIVNRAHPTGPLWVVSHDDENATFAAALAAVNSWGGVVMVVDAHARDGNYGARFNTDTGSQRPVDPNRNFREGLPVYRSQMLRDLLPARRLIVALHANALGADPALPRCPGEVIWPGGSGDISVALCTARFSPRRSQSRLWPFDDDDTLALVPHLADAPVPTSGWCSAPLARLDFNLVYESVGYSDGSLSNYAVQHGLDYINFETRDRGNDATGIALGRDRLIAMVDRMMDRCAPIAGLTLRPPRR